MDAMFSQYPRTRLRRLRMHHSLRTMVQDVALRPSDVIQPFFIIEGEAQKEEIGSMAGIHRYSLDLLLEEVQECYDLGMRAVALFPVTPIAKKDNQGTEALNPNNLMCRAIRLLKENIPDMMLITDVALDPYTLHGHDGVLDQDGLMQNDATIDILVKQSLLQAEAGADIIAPSDMTDGRIGVIRDAFEQAGFHNICIMSYAAKYASAFYGPFRDAVGSASSLKSDKKNYQMDYHNSDEALKEIEMDILEGADMVIVKPGMAYLDIIVRAKAEFNIPLFAYQVSGEYAMLDGAIKQGLFDRKTIIYESLIAFKRAGCTGILTYFAKEFLQK